MQHDMSVPATNTTRIPVSELTTFQPTAPHLSAAAKAPEPAETETIIAPSRGWVGVNWGELFRGRELLYFLVWRDVKVRYKQAVLGIGWAILQPMMSMLIFTVVFGAGLGLKKDLPAGIPYAFWVYCGLLPWQFFSTALGLGGMSLVNQQNLLTKIYFPRLFVPTAVIGRA